MKLRPSESKEHTKCYMCVAIATSKEHVPPDCFFPKGYRDNLTTVPSCPTHNNDNSKDVEYVRNIVVTHHATNEVARVHFREKALKSFKRSPKLFSQTLQNAKEILFNGEITGVGILDLTRFKSSMKAIAFGIYFGNYGKSFDGDWEIFGTGLVSTEALFEGKADGSEDLRRVLTALTFEELTMPQPEVFRCKRHQWDDVSMVYEFLFYGGFLVHAISLPNQTSVASHRILPTN